MAKRYQPQALLSEQDGVQTFSGRDALNGLPVRLYSFMGEPTSRPGDLTSPHIPPVLETNHVGGAGEVVTAFAPEFRPLTGTVPPQQVEMLLRHSAAALDDAARAGVVHGDLSPTRLFYDADSGRRFVLEGYGVPWRVRPSEFSPPERIGGATFAGDLFSWAMTVRHLAGPLPGDLRDLLARCLGADPAARPHAREVRYALDTYAFSSRHTAKPQAARDESAFEDFASNESEAEQHEAHEADLTPHETSGWHIPLPPLIADKVEKPPTQDRVAEDPAEKDKGLENRAVKDKAEKQAGETRKAKQGRTSRELPEPLPPPLVQETNLPPESLRRTDGTSAYKVRRDRLQAEQGADTDTTLPDTTLPEIRRSSSRVKGEPLRRECPAAPEPRQDTENMASTGSSARTGNPVSPGNPVRSANTRSSPGAPLGELKPVTPPNLDDDFEVIDDIDDHAPDPTRGQGGLRVLLATLLVIAIVVLLALQFI